MSSLRPLLLAAAARVLGAALGLALAWQVAAHGVSPPPSADAASGAGLAFTGSVLATKLTLSIQL